MSDGVGEVRIPKTLTLTVVEGMEIEALVTLQRGPDGKLNAVAQPCVGQLRLPRESPKLLRFLADAIDIDLLDEVPRAD